MDRFGLSDPFLVVSRIDPSSAPTPIHKTEVIDNNLNPEWKPFSISLVDMCPDTNGNIKAKDPLLLIECFDHDTIGSSDLIGNFQVSLLYDIGSVIFLVNAGSSCVSSF